MFCIELRNKRLIKGDRKMADIIKLTAEKRNEGKNPRQLRAEGLLPATVYGKGKESMSIQLNSKEFTQAYKKNSEATFELSIDKKAYKTVAQAVQENYATNTIQSVEFKLV